MLKIGRFSEGSATLEYLENQSIYDLFKLSELCYKIEKEKVKK